LTARERISEALVEARAELVLLNAPRV